MKTLLEMSGLAAASGGKWWFGRAVSAMGMIAVMIVACTALISVTLMSGAYASYIMLLHEGLDTQQALLAVVGMVMILVAMGILVMGLYLRRRLYRKPSGIAYINEMVDAFLDGLVMERRNS